jgi:predicted RNA-binding Zn-ribbon protein involved in translation (DUF1610 family)
MGLFNTVWVTCSNQSCRARLRAAIGLAAFSCPICGMTTQMPSKSAIRFLGADAAQQRQLPLKVQARTALDRLTGRQPVWGFNNQFVIVACTGCSRRHQVSVTVNQIQCTCNTVITVS